MTPRIIIAHGFGSSDVIAKSEQTNNIRASLEAAGYKVEYVRGPFKLTVDDFPFEPVRDPTKVDLYSWWDLKSLPNPPLGTTIDFIKSLNNEEDPIVGFLGLSQGGSLTTLVATNFKEWNIPTLKFAAAYGGFLYPRPDVTPVLSAYNGKIEIPFLTVVGEEDKSVLPSQSIQAAEELVAEGKSSIHRHAGGHIFADDEESVRKLLSWIKEQTK